MALFAPAFLTIIFTIFGKEKFKKDPPINNYKIISYSQEYLLKTFIDIFKLIQTSKHKVNMYLAKNIDTLISSSLLSTVCLSWFLHIYCTQSN